MQSNNLAAVVGRNIYRLRKSSGMTQAQLSEQLDITPAFLSRVERGEKMVSTNVLQALTDVFHVSYDGLMLESNDRPSILKIVMLLMERPETYDRLVEDFIYTIDGFQSQAIDSVLTGGGSADDR